MAVSSAQLRCGRRTAKRTCSLHWRSNAAAAVSCPCSPTCDPDPAHLEARASAVEEAAKEENGGKLQAYLTPDASYWEAFRDFVCEGTLGWDDFFTILPKEDAARLAPLDLKVDYITRRGGQACVTAKQKKSLVRAVWKPADVTEQLPTPASLRAFTFLMEHNDTYRSYVLRRRELLRANANSGNAWRYVPTAQLLLQMPGIEVAARPWLYVKACRPEIDRRINVLVLFSRTDLQASLGDTDVSDRLKALGVLKASSTPSAKTHWLRKVLSRNVDFVKDYSLQALLHDVTMARTITAVVAVAEKQKISPDEAAADMPQFEQYWHHQAQKLEDVCRQAGKFPNLFFTIAPAEWRFPLHAGMFSKEDQEDLSQCQAWLTMHMRNCIAAVLDAVLWKNKAQAAELGIAEIEHYTYRFEFQGRGTIHVHAVAWVKYNPGVCVEELSGRSGARGQTSPLVRLLEEIFDCGAVDVQCGQSEHNLLRYVAGYVAKASDCLRFQKGDEGRGAPAETSRWRQVYRLLCKPSPLEQELAMYFAGLPMVETSFTGDRMYPPIPGSTAVNKYRHAYLAYQERLLAAHEEHCQVQELAEDGRVLQLRNFVEWCRLFRLHQYVKTGEDSWSYVVRQRNARGRPRLEAELCLPADELVPENMQHLAMLLRLHNGDVEAVLEPMVEELRWRGLGEDRQAICGASPRRTGGARAEDWSARSIRAPPRRIWSVEQQAVLDAISAGVQPQDADAAVPPHPRLLRMTGGQQHKPGGGCCWAAPSACWSLGIAVVSHLAWTSQWKPFIRPSRLVVIEMLPTFRPVAFVTMT